MPSGKVNAKDIKPGCVIQFHGNWAFWGLHEEVYTPGGSNRPLYERDVLGIIVSNIVIPISSLGTMAELSHGHDVHELLVLSSRHKKLMKTRILSSDMTHLEMIKDNVGMQ